MFFPVLRSTLLVLLVAFAAGEAVAAPITREMEFERYLFDLETGDTYDFYQLPGPFPADFDFWFAYNALAPVHIVLLQNQSDGARVAYFDEIPFADVDCTLAQAAIFTSDFIAEPLEIDDTMVVLTGDGSLFKVGNALEIGSPQRVRFSYEPLCPVPEPSCLALAGLAVAATVGGAGVGAWRQRAGLR